MKDVWVFLISAGILLGVMVYIDVILHHMHITAQAMGKPQELAAASGLQKVRVLFYGWKTHLLVGLATVPHLMLYIDGGLLANIGYLPWANILDQRTADAITFICLALIPLTHAIGLAACATATPQSPENP